MHEELGPGYCRNGHPLVHGKVIVGWHPCQCIPVEQGGQGGHRT
jgi:hypothetical protein